MKPKIFWFLVVLLSFSDFVTADLVQFPIFSYPANKLDLDVSGNIVVWADNRYGKYATYGIDLNAINRGEFLISSLGQESWSPAIDGHEVVWIADNSLVYVKNLIRGAPLGIDSSAVQKRSPRISSGTIIWVGIDAAYNSNIYGRSQDTNGRWGNYFIVTTSNKVVAYNIDIDGDNVVWLEGYELYLKNLNNGTIQYLLETPLTPFSPRFFPRPKIDNNIVVWIEKGRYGDCDIFGKDLVTGAEFVISDAAGDQFRPNISGNFVVWTDHRNGNFDIFGKNLVTGEEFPICTNNANQVDPVIDGNLVVWWDYRNGGTYPDIYGAYIIPEPTTLILVLPGTILLILLKPKNPRQKTKGFFV